MTDLVGTVVGGKYKVVSMLGTGGMGDVYEAEDVDEGWTGKQSVALKVLRVEDDGLVARFLREAKTMSLFAHPNIVELVEVGKLDDGRLFFAAELVRGDTLRTLIDAGPVEPKRALAIVRQILDALGHAHAMGVVHRDIKPENVMLADDVVKILDFGVAKLVGDTPAVLGESTLTITGYGALGTPYYMSPEAVLGRPVDARADIYSIGALLFEMLTGKPPYMHEDVAVLMRMHAAAPIPLIPDTTPEVSLLVTEALAKKPELRYANAAEMITAVDAAVRSLEPWPVSTRSTDVFGALPLKPPATPAAGMPLAPAPFAPAPLEPAPTAQRAKRTSRVNLPGVAPYQTPVAGSPLVPPVAGPAMMAHAPSPPHLGGPVMGVVMPANSRPSAPIFAPPMPPQPVQAKRPHRWRVLAQRHKQWVLVGSGVALAIILVVVVALAAGGGKQAATTAEKPAKAQKRPDLARGAAELIAAGHPSRAVELIEREDVGDDDDTLVVLGHARIGANRRLDGLAAYERAIALDAKHAADPQVKANVTRVLESRDAVAGMVALELAMRLDPAPRDLVKQLATNGKVGDIRRRAFAIAERERFSEDLDRVASWSLDLAQATTCEDRLVAIAKLRRTTDARAIPALKKARTHRCVEREVSEAIGFLESQTPPPTPNP